MEIKISVVGKIISGDDIGKYIKVIDDTKDSGGFLILTSTTEDMMTGFDSWVEDKNSLMGFFLESDWIVRWID